PVLLERADHLRGDRVDHALDAAGAQRAHGSRAQRRLAPLHRPRAPVLRVLWPRRRGSRRAGGAGRRVLAGRSPGYVDPTAAGDAGSRRGSRLSYLQLRRYEQTCLIGTAKFRFSPPPETSTPTTRPCLSIAGPPELPGFAAASVWIAFLVTRLTIPVVTVPSRP